MGLQDILEKAIQIAIINGHKTLELRGGLFIGLVVKNRCILEITLRRMDKPPSLAEWETVLKYFPWSVNTQPQPSGNTLAACLTIHPKFL